MSIYRKKERKVKEKTFKDLGLEGGDKFLDELDLDLGELNKVLESKEDEQELKKKIKEINYKV